LAQQCKLALQAQMKSLFSLEGALRWVFKK
jgi:hypothetical protein